MKLFDAARSSGVLMLGVAAVTVPANAVGGAYDMPPVVVQAPPPPTWYDTCGINCPWLNNAHSNGTLWRPNRGAAALNSYDWLDASSCDKETSGNPVVLSTGNKVERELDFSSEGEMGLFLERTYNHHWGQVGLFGGHWLSNFDYTLVVAKDFNNVGGVMWAQRPDGRRIAYQRPTTDPVWYEHKASAVSYIKRDSVTGRYVLHNEDGGVEEYLSLVNDDGKSTTFGMPIAKLRNRHGIGWDFTYTYQSRYLTKVTHTSGRSVQFGWSNGNLVSVADPAGNVYEYAYTPNVFAGGSRLASTKLPGAPATVITYHYEDGRYPGALTGKSFNGVRYSTFTYDDKRRATSTSHAGGVERYEFGYQSDNNVFVIVPPVVWSPGNRSYPYDPDNDGDACCTYVPSNSTTTEINPLGRRTTFSYSNRNKTGVSGDASPTCPSAASSITRDANSYEDVVRDFAGNATDFDFDAHGHLLRKVEASGTAVARTFVYEWDEANNRIAKETLEGQRETRYSYDGGGRVTAETEKNLNANGSIGQERTTTYSYALHGSGMLASVTRDGPLAGSADAETWTYDATGALLSHSNGLGHTVRYENHTAFGRPGRIVSAAGAITDYGYDGRGRVVLVRTFPSGQPSDTQYVYNASGLLDAIQHPDGTLEIFAYDAARRLVEQDRSAPGGGYEVRKTFYNAMSQPTRVEVGRDD